MSKLYQYIALSLLTSVAGVFVGLLFIPASVIAVANIIFLVLMLMLLIGAWILKLVRKNNGGHLRFPIWAVYLFAFAYGAMMYPVLVYYLASPGVVLFFEIVIGTMVVFAVLAFIAQKKESGSFVGLSGILLVILTVMAVLSVLNLFLRVDMLSLILSALGIAVFSAYILFDVNQFKTEFESGTIIDSSDYSIHVLNVYLDIINLLLDILDVVDWVADIFGD